MAVWRKKPRLVKMAEVRVCVCVCMVCVCVHDVCLYGVCVCVCVCVCVRVSTSNVFDKTLNCNNLFNCKVMQSVQLF